MDLPVNLPRHQFTHSRRAAGSLPPLQFGELAGSVDHATLVPEGALRPDDNHLYLWVRVAAGPFLGVYECAFNIHSAEASDVLFTDWREEITGKAFPAAGFSMTPLSYVGLGLKDADFAPVQQGDLQTLVTHYAQTCTLMAAYGTTYKEGTGLHDIHLNTGEAAGSRHSDRSGQDGALVFYFASRSAGTSPYARWIFVKFDTQHLPA